MDETIRQLEVRLARLEMEVANIARLKQLLAPFDAYYEREMMLALEKQQTE
jgi:hypothetical protein